MKAILNAIYALNFFTLDIILGNEAVALDDIRV